MVKRVLGDVSREACYKEVVLLSSPSLERRRGSARRDPLSFFERVPCPVLLSGPRSTRIALGSQRRAPLGLADQSYCPLGAHSWRCSSGKEGRHSSKMRRGCQFVFPALGGGRWRLRFGVDLLDSDPKGCSRLSEGGNPLAHRTWACGPRLLPGVRGLHRAFVMVPLSRTPVPLVVTTFGVKLPPCLTFAPSVRLGFLCMHRLS